ncbi:hypothetical protein DIPPA_04818 [Diplonema papillatum]|nr:hypothetical protein DIPPA_04818 [Diplonema papillatum]
MAEDPTTFVRNLEAHFFATLHMVRDDNVVEKVLMMVARLGGLLVYTADKNIITMSCLDEICGMLVSSPGADGSEFLVLLFPSRNLVFKTCPDESTIHDRPATAVELVRQINAIRETNVQRTIEPKAVPPDADVTYLRLCTATRPAKGKPSYRKFTVETGGDEALDLGMDVLVPPHREAVHVRRVKDGSAAARCGLSKGAYIVEIAGDRITEGRQYAKLLKRLKKGNPQVFELIADVTEAEGYATEPLFRQESAATQRPINISLPPSKVVVCYVVSPAEEAALKNGKADPGYRRAKRLKRNVYESFKALRDIVGVECAVLITNATGLPPDVTTGPATGANIETALHWLHAPGGEGGVDAGTALLALVGDSDPETCGFYPADYPEAGLVTFESIAKALPDDDRAAYIDEEEEIPRTVVLMDTDPPSCLGHRYDAFPQAAAPLRPLVVVGVERQQPASKRAAKHHHHHQPRYPKGTLLSCYAAAHSQGEGLRMVNFMAASLDEGSDVLIVCSGPFCDLKTQTQVQLGLGWHKVRVPRRPWLEGDLLNWLAGFYSCFAPERSEKATKLAADHAGHESKLIRSLMLAYARGGTAREHCVIGSAEHPVTTLEFVNHLYRVLVSDTPDPTDIFGALEYIGVQKQWNDVCSIFQRRFSTPLVDALEARLDEEQVKSCRAILEKEHIDFEVDSMLHTRRLSSDEGVGAHRMSTADVHPSTTQSATSRGSTPPPDAAARTRRQQSAEAATQYTTTLSLVKPSSGASIGVEMHGRTVLKVRPASPADHSGMRPGMVLVAVGGVDIREDRGKQDITEAFDRAAAGEALSVVVAEFAEPWNESFELEKRRLDAERRAFEAEMVRERGDLNASLHQERGKWQREQQEERTRLLQAEREKWEKEREEERKGWQADNNQRGAHSREDDEAREEERLLLLSREREKWEKEREEERKKWEAEQKVALDKQHEQERERWEKEREEERKAWQAGNNRRGSHTREQEEKQLLLLSREREKWEKEREGERKKWEAEQKAARDKQREEERERWEKEREEERKAWQAGNNQRGAHSREHDEAREEERQLLLSREREKWEKERADERSRWQAGEGGNPEETTQRLLAAEREKWEKEREEERKKWEAEQKVALDEQREQERERWEKERNEEREKWQRERTTHGGKADAASAAAKPVVATMQPPPRRASQPADLRRQEPIRPKTVRTAPDELPPSPTPPPGLNHTGQHRAGSPVDPPRVEAPASQRPPGTRSPPHSQPSDGLPPNPGYQAAAAVQPPSVGHAAVAGPPSSAAQAQQPRRPPSIAASDHRSLASEPPRTGGLVARNSPRPPASPSVPANLGSPAPHASLAPADAIDYVPVVWEQTRPRDIVFNPYGVPPYRMHFHSPYSPSKADQTSDVLKQIRLDIEAAELLLRQPPSKRRSVSPLLVEAARRPASQPRHQSLASASPGARHPSPHRTPEPPLHREDRDPAPLLFGSTPTPPAAAVGSARPSPYETPEAPHLPAAPNSRASVVSQATRQHSANGIPLAHGASHGEHWVAFSQLDPRGPAPHTAASFPGNIVDVKRYSAASASDTRVPSERAAGRGSEADDESRRRSSVLGEAVDEVARAANGRGSSSSVSISALGDTTQGRQFESPANDTQAARILWDVVFD